jgi:aerobic-type carbon monoxide dehydrogenase small subunit (CoxS/CutS family)
VSERLAYELEVNGERVPVHARAEATLLEVLREDLALTGAKRGCNQGVCGACTVLLDGVPARGCLTLAANVGGRAVTTIEGVAREGAFSPVQRAMVESGAIQCGFCTPGMILTLEALLRDNPTPSAEDVREGISGNLCRCSGYVKIVEAALAAAGAKP